MASAAASVSPAATWGPSVAMTMPATLRPASCLTAAVAPSLVPLSLIGTRVTVVPPRAKRRAATTAPWAASRHSAPSPGAPVSVSWTPMVSWPGTSARSSTGTG